jgi:hypothetical protein
MSEQQINVTWPSVDGWITKNLGVLEPDAMRTVAANEVTSLVPEGALALLSLTVMRLPEISDSLPNLNSLKTSTPVWRSTIGLSTHLAQTSYQGEIDPFPQQGTLLTFGPFLQYGAGVENFLVLLNIENAPAFRNATLEIFNPDGGELKAKIDVQNNKANVIPLNDLGFKPGELPLFICRGMSGVPLYFSRTIDGGFLSLEHTHPPSSFVVHGKRIEAQRVLKKNWFDRAARWL